MIRATFSGFTTALSAIQANQKRLDITGHNLANMYTSGYTRQQLEASSMNYSKPISHYMNGSEIAVGFGTKMNKVSQIRDPYLDIQYRDQMTKSSYTDTMQDSLDALSKVFDESQISGIRQAIDNMQTTLTHMQDSAKVNDPIYESDLRSQMLSLTNLLNDGARQIDKAEENEYEKLNGKGTTEEGDVDQVNELLRQIGDLNREIKRNQILGQQSLEMIDERNVLIDELASYIPIEVTYYKDKEHSGANMYDYDQNGNVIGKKEWPDDLKIEMLYTDSAGVSQRLTLVDGTEGNSQKKNYGELEITAELDAEKNPIPRTVQITFKEAQSIGTNKETMIGYDDGSSQLSSGSIQASVDMLTKTGDGNSIGKTDGSKNKNLDTVRGYQYYEEKLNTFAKEFAQIINDINNRVPPYGQKDDKAGGNLLVNKDADPDDTTAVTKDITALNIGINPKWIQSGVHVSKAGESGNDTVLNMLEAMSKKHEKLENKTFADYINNTATILANDSYRNTNNLKTDVTVLNSIQDSRDSVSGVSLDEEAANMMTALSAYNAASRIMTALDEALNTLINNTGLVGR